MLRPNPDHRQGADQFGCIVSDLLSGFFGNRSYFDAADFPV
jgi:hypothetical protein